MCSVKWVVRGEVTGLQVGYTDLARPHPGLWLGLTAPCPLLLLCSPGVEGAGRAGTLGRCWPEARAVQNICHHGSPSQGPASTAPTTKWQDLGRCDDQPQRRTSPPGQALPALQLRWVELCNLEGP